MTTDSRDPHSGSPDDVQDPLDLILELADICRDAWPAVKAGLRASGVPLCEGDENGPPGSTSDALADPATPAPGASTTVDWDSPDNPWKTRFEGYRPEADRKITRLSQYEQAVQDFQSGDPAEMRRAAAILGIADHLEIEEPEPPTYDDPAEELRAQIAAQQAELAQFKNELTEKEKAQKEEAGIKEVNARLQKLLPDDEDDRNVVLGLALTRPPGEDGLPDVQAAFDAIVARDRKRDKGWADGKRRGHAPIAPGSPATPQKNIADMTRADGSLTKEGLDYLAEQYEARVNG